MATVHDNTFLVVLGLTQDTTQSKVAGICVQDVQTGLSGKSQYWGVHQGGTQGSKDSRAADIPHKRYVLARRSNVAGALHMEEDGDLEDVFAVGDRPSWTNRRSPDPVTSPSKQQMFALACRMGYDMRPIARQPDAQRQSSGNRSFPDQSRGFRSQAHTGRDYSRIKCFSCGEFGHMQARCPQPDSSLPFKPACWQIQSDNRPQRDRNIQQGNSP